MLLPITAAFITGLLVGSFLPYLPVVLLLLLLVAGIVLTAWERGGTIGHAQSFIVYGGVLAGVTLWTVASSSTGSRLLQSAGPTEVRVVGTIVEPVKHAPGRTTMVLAVSQLGSGADARPASGRVRLTWRDPDQSFVRGARLEVTARLHPPSGLLNPGGFDYRAYLERQGIDAVASVSGPGRVTRSDAVSESDRAGLPERWDLPGMIVDRWRDRIRQAALATLHEPALGLCLGMIIGEPGYVSAELRDAFMATGTVHILSISGSHLGLIAFLSFFAIRWAWRHLPPLWLLALSRRITPTRLAAVVTIVPVTFYTLLAGSEVATVRSLIMILFFLLAIWLGRVRDLLLTLAGAALVILLHDPRALFDISFQLSYLSVLAIAVVVKWRIGGGRGEGEGVVSRSGEWLRNYLWLTAGVTLTTMPLVAYYFNQVAWLGLGANLFVVPFAGFVLVPVGLLSAVWVLVTGGEGMPGAAFLQFLFDLLSAAVAGMAKIPGAEWHVASPTIVSIVLFYLLLHDASRPQRTPARRTVCMLALALLLGWWTWSPRMTDGGSLRVAFLDVGQGDASVIELPDGRTILIDGGAAYDTLDMGRAAVGPYLWDRGIRRLDHVIGTHPQLDHVGGLAWVLRVFDVGRYWGNGVARDEAFFHRLQDAMQQRGVVEQRVEEGQVLLDSVACRLKVLNPPPVPSALEARIRPVLSGGTDLNNLSVVTRLDCGPHSFLFTADVEIEALSKLRAQSGSKAVQVLKVPHHGSRSSLDEAWIRQVKPETAVISVGSRNPYGHPAGSVLAAYEQAGVRLFRTDRDGAVWVTANVSSPEMEVLSARGILARRIALPSWRLEDEFLNVVRLWKHWSTSS